jgi:hypothetical protein
MKVCLGESAAALQGTVSAPPGLEPSSSLDDLAELQALQRQRLMLHSLLQAQMQAQLQAQMQVQAHAQLLAYQKALACADQHDAKPHDRRSVASASTASGDACSEISDESLTTVIVKKMPKAFTRDMLVSLLEKHGFSRSFDFVYVPVEFDKGVSTGCAFINFVDSASAESFKQRFHGFRKWGVQCGHTKKAEITWSQSCQGRDAHIERYRNSSVMHESVPDHFKPALFVDGARVAFPSPTRGLRAPERRAQC